MHSIALISSSYIERDIDYESSCHNCIRPATRLIIGTDMKIRPSCKKFNGYTCCGVECDDWNMQDNLCIFHGKIHSRHEGFYKLQNDDIYRYYNDNKEYIKTHITNNKHFTVKQVLEIAKLKTKEKKRTIDIYSQQFIFQIIYSKALNYAGKKHLIIKQVFAQYLKPELYQWEMIWD